MPPTTPKVTFQSTPNPNALKCVPDAPIPPLPNPPEKRGAVARSYLDPASAEGDPLARAIFALPGVRNVLIHEKWLTVGKDPDAPWKPIRDAIAKILAAPPGGAT